MGIIFINGYVVEIKRSKESMERIIDGFVTCRNELDISDTVKRNECIKSLNDVIETFSKKIGKWSFYSAKVNYDQMEIFYDKAIKECSPGDEVRLLNCMLKVSSESNYCISWDESKPYKELKRILIE